jgi:pyruvate/2-oxoglutarate dehydrogenase complex dihydrolipoamide dehydrogenase (E3) component
VIESGGRTGGKCSMHGRDIQNVLVRTSEGMNHLENQGSRWKDNIKIEFKEMTMESLDAIHGSQRRSVVDKVMKLLTAVCKFNNVKFTPN